jgi:hypothetical protein
MPRRYRRLGKCGLISIERDALPGKGRPAIAGRSTDEGGGA